MVRALAAAGTDVLDDKVRSRLAEIQAAAGVPHSQISLEVLYFLPEGFLRQYAELFEAALRSDGGESAAGARAAQAGELGKTRVGAAKTNGKRYKRTFVVLDDRALALKTTIDKRLRNLGRDIRTAMEQGWLMGEQNLKQCSGCGMFLQLGWKYCPKDGRGVDVLDE